MPTIKTEITPIAMRIILVEVHGGYSVTDLIVFFFFRISYCSSPVFVFSISSALSVPWILSLSFSLYLSIYLSITVYLVAHPLSLSLSLSLSISLILTLSFIHIPPLSHPYSVVFFVCYLPFQASTYPDIYPCGGIWRKSSSVLAHSIVCNPLITYLVIESSVNTTKGAQLLISHYALTVKQLYLVNFCTGLFSLSRIHRRGMFRKY